MGKRLTILILVFLCTSSVVFAQTLSLSPYGVSPRDAERDTADIFDRAYNGLLNVGVETQMYLEGRLDGASLSSPTWTVTGPAGSAADITVTFDPDTSTQIAAFTPDVVGTYTVEFADGENNAIVTINAATYVGAFAGDGNCVLCHQAQAADWEKTGHYSIFERGLNGMLGAYYAERCISCHTTGYDADANNDGFDDRGFVFPDTLFPGQFDNMVAQYPDAMKLARVQCESCHGPGSAHNVGNVSDSKMVSTLDAANCAWCHDAGTHHIFPYQWDVSRHGKPLHAARGSRAGCAPCHSGAGFVEWVKGGKEELISAPEVTAITCAVCHEPHSVDYPHQVRTMDATLGNGTIVKDGGLGLLCMNCHKSRRDAKTYTNAPGSHYGPHYAPQADVLAATNVVTFGKTLPTSPHNKGNSCVDCHMAESHELDLDVLAGGHSFKMSNNLGQDHIEACEGCHGNIGESFAEKKFYFNGNADHDGDGVEEGLQEEVHGLMEQLGALLPDADPHANVDTTWTLTELKAAYNHRTIYYDHSDGIHNPAFTVALLKVTIQALLNNAIEGEIVAIEDVPNDQGKQVRIIWDKFVDDGVAVDPVATYLIQRLDAEDDWTGVGEYTAHGANRYALVVPTLYDSTAYGNALTTFKVVALTRGGVVHESLPAQGYSVDNLVPHAPGNLMAMAAAGDVELTWEEPPDPDIQYYKIYRSAEDSFVPDESLEIGATAELTFTDVLPGTGTWYYKVVAIDFSGNLGKPSPSVSATITSVDDSQTVPMRFELSQNYPNPFNPETTIKFSLKNGGHVSLEIFNATGQSVSSLVDKNMNPGNYSINFSANGLTSGVYFYRIKVSATNDGVVQYQSMKKMVVMK